MFSKSTQPGLNDSVVNLTGIGTNLKNKLERIGILTIQDLLFHLPYRYIDRTRLVPIGFLKPGCDAYIQGVIDSTQVKYGRRRSLLCRISDKSGAIALRFFYFSKTQQNKLTKGLVLRCYGQVRRGAHSLEMVHPEYRCYPNGADESLEEELTPVYRSTEGLRQTSLRKLNKQALHILRQDEPLGLAELIPDVILAAHHLQTLVDALLFAHQPPPDANINALIEGRHPAQKRLAFEELLAHQLSLLELRKELRKEQSPALKKSTQLVPAYLSKLPFRLTKAQTNAFKVIEHDLSQSIAMLRLVQGDVGSGKTVIAAMASLQTIEAGYQVAIMAPTGILAEQHYNHFQTWLAPFAIEVILITAKLKKSLRETIKNRLKKATPCVVIGTHALLQASIRFAKLGLVIIDEQHRFGVHQRLTLREKGRQYEQFPHQLIMTATPIPRTLTMTAYADLDHTIIDELPANKATIHTSVMSNKKRENIIERIAHVCQQGRQVYWICTLIDESETRQCETAIATWETLQQKIPAVDIGLLHGRMKTEEKETVMQQFKQGDLQLLVSTTVIEVGVNVPNASLMIIDNAEFLGLSQLHQLRGRVGRGQIESDCVLLYQPPLSDIAKQRLSIMRTCRDGFIIAKKDLELRGPGEMLGTKQAGMPSMRTANLIKDVDLLGDVHRAAKIMSQDYPDQVAPLVQRWLGHNMDYSHA